MTNESKIRKGEVRGGLLDPAIDKSYYHLSDCPRRGREATLEEHRECEDFGGEQVDPETGGHLLYCEHEEE